MKLMVCGHASAWCYVDTETKCVELVEIWAWDEELAFENDPWVIAEAAEEDGNISPREEAGAVELARRYSADAPLVVARDPRQTRLQGT